MPRYLVERTFPDGLHIPIDEAGVGVCSNVIDVNAQQSVTWVHSYVNEEKTKTFCIYDAPHPEAVRHAAQLNQLPVDSITRVTVLDPYFYS